jgi:hypothetical protein
MHSIKTHGPLILSESSGAAKMEFMSLLRLSSLALLNRLTEAYMASFTTSKSCTFLDYILPFALYKRYAKHVQDEQRTHWSMTRFLVRDPIVSRYLSFEGGLQAQLREFHGSHGTVFLGV